MEGYLWFEDTLGPSWIDEEMMVQDKGSGGKSRPKEERARNQVISVGNEGRELIGLLCCTNAKEIHDEIIN